MVCAIIKTATMQTPCSLHTCTSIPPPQNTTQIGVPGVSDTGLTALTKEQRISLCNDYWTSQLPRLGILEFSRERKMMSSMNGRFDAPVLFTKVLVVYMCLL